MTSSSKLIAAGLLLALGYGVASFLGSPKNPYLAPSTRAALDAHARAQPPEPASPSAPDERLNARLVPEIASESILPRVASPAPALVATDSIHPLISGNVPALTARPPGLLPPVLEAEKISPAAPVGGVAAVFDSTATSAATISVGQFADIGVDHAPQTPNSVPPPGARPLEVRWTPSDTNHSSMADVTIKSTPVLGPVELASARLPGDMQTRADIAAYEATAPGEPVALAPPVDRYPVPIAEGDSDLRRHIITDGDSLDRLAARYLGDAARSAEIFELNRSLIDDPQLLPIGIELRIPPRPVQTTSNVSLSPPFAAGGAVSAISQTTNAAPMVNSMAGPVPPSPAGAPQARLLGPIPTGPRKDAPD